ncbi:MAG: phosphoribosyl-AMP cyclohydrolase [Planctomycetes bacterium]|nr:phosphoribosyl-AMP cyclohydrolase [Planctomycetota bacterium]
MDYPFIETLKFDDNGLIPAVVVDHETNEVLMVAYMNRGSLKDTMEKKLTSFWSRSRQQYWTKGESSGHTQEVKEIRTDCDNDTLVIKVKQNGAACHVGYYSCFYKLIQEDGTIQEVGEKVFNPDDVYDK